MRHQVYRPVVGHDFVRGLTLALPLNVVLWAMLVGVALKLR